MIKALNIRTVIVFAMLAVAVLIMAGSAFAKNDGGTAKPGWGYGDNNHTHTGPPGQSVRP